MEFCEEYKPQFRELIYWLLNLLPIFLCLLTFWEHHGSWSRLFQSVKATLWSWMRLGSSTDTLEALWLSARSGWGSCWAYLRQHRALVFHVILSQFLCNLKPRSKCCRSWVNINGHYWTKGRGITIDLCFFLYPSSSHESEMAKDCSSLQPTWFWLGRGRDRDKVTTLAFGMPRAYQNIT